MPRVPVIERQVRSVGIQTPLLRSGVTPEDFGENIAEAGLQFAAAATEFQERRDTVAAKKADIEWNKRASALMFDPQTGYLTLEGDTAIESANEVKERLSNLREEISGTLTGNAQSLFDGPSSRQLLRRTEQVDQHVITTQDALEEATSQARASEFLNLSQLDYNDPQALAQYKRAAFIEIESQAGSPELAEAAQKEWLANQHSAVLKQMMIHDPKGAQQYIKDHRSELGANLTELEESVEQTNHLARVQAHEDRIWNPNLTEAQMLDEARKIRDPDERKDTLSNLRTRADDADAAKTAADIIAITELTNQAHSFQLPLDFHDPNLSPAQNDFVRAQVKKAHDARRGALTVNSQATYQRLLDQRLTDPVGFEKEILIQYKLELDADLYSALLSEQNRMKSARKTSEAIEPDGVMSTGARFKQIAVNNGMTNTDDQDSIFYNIDIEIRRENSKRIGAGQAQLTEEEVEGFYQRGLRKVVEDGWVNGDIRRANVRDDTVLIVPETFRRSVKKAAADRGDPEPTEAQIQTGYRNKVRDLRQAL